MNESSISKLNEEINLLYVAITRTKNSLHIPEILVPAECPGSAYIHILKELKEEVSETPEIEGVPPVIADQNVEKFHPPKEKAYSVIEFRYTRFCKSGISFLKISSFLTRNDGNLQP